MAKNMKQFRALIFLRFRSVTKVCSMQMRTTELPHMTEVLCVNEAGQMIATDCFGPVNINGATRERVTQTIRDADGVAVASRTDKVVVEEGYAVIRQAREMIRQGALGELVHVRVSHPEDWIIESVSPTPTDGPVPWRFQPERIGEALCTGDLGTHAEQLLVQFTGLHIKRVLAMLDTYPRHLPLETNTTVLLDLGEGISGELWASQIALGKICSPEIYVIGTEGALEWRHEQPDTLRYTRRGGATELLVAGKDYMLPESNRLTRVSAGHHEGFFEAFGNIYRGFCHHLLAKKEGREAESYTFPTIADGLDGMKFIAACVESHRAGNIWVTL